MKHFFFILAFLFSFKAFTFQVDIQGLNGDYQAPNGTALAKKFILKGLEDNFIESTDELVKISFVKKDESIDLTFGDQNYFWKNPPQFILEAKTAEIKNIMTKTYRQVIKSDIGFAKFDSPKDFFKLNLFSLFCQNPGRTQPKPSDFVINACTTQSKISVKKVTYKDKTGKNPLTKLLNRIIPEGRNGNTDIVINSLKLNVVKHQFTLKSSVDYSIRTSISAKGRSWYDLKTKVLKIRLDQVKVSVFNITSKVFKELEENQNDNMKVDRPYIYIQNNFTTLQ